MLTLVYVCMYACVYVCVDLTKYMSYPSDRHIAMMFMKKNKQKNSG